MTTRKVLTVTAAGAAALVLAACGAPTRGVVDDKEYDDPDTWWVTVADYDTRSYPCTKTRTRTTGTGTTRTTRIETYTTTCSKRVKVGTHEERRYDGAHYELLIVDGDRSGWVTVDRATYDRAAIGDTYDHGKITKATR